MIGWLSGRMLGWYLPNSSAGTSLGTAELLLDVGGVGYRVQVPLDLARDCGAPGSHVAVFVHTHVREDAISLFGFARRSERDLFEALLAAHGVGPSLAMAIVSMHSPEELAAIVHMEDADALTVVPGVGRKTAEKLIVELRSRLERARVEAGAEVVDPEWSNHGPLDQPRGQEAGTIDAGAFPSAGLEKLPKKEPTRETMGAGASDPRARVTLKYEVHQEVRGALESLGYSPEEISRALREVEPSEDLEALLRSALRTIGPKIASSVRQPPGSATPTRDSATPSGRREHEADPEHETDMV
jgi:Holliday junction DNA helicase RuvA subunit